MSCCSPLQQPLAATLTLLPLTQAVASQVPLLLPDLEARVESDYVVEVFGESSWEAWLRDPTKGMLNRNVSYRHMNLRFSVCVCIPRLTG